jgi:hypothetical protein
VGDDQAPGAYIRKEFVQIVDIAFLVGIEKHDVDGTLQLLDLFMSVAFHERDKVLHRGLLEIRPGCCGTLGIDLVGGQFSARLLECQAVPDTGIACGGALRSYL